MQPMTIGIIIVNIPLVLWLEIHLAQSFLSSKVAFLKTYSYVALVPSLATIFLQKQWKGPAPIE